MSQVRKHDAANRALFRTLFYFTVANTLCVLSWTTNAVLVPYLFHLGIFDFSFSDAIFLIAAPILSAALVQTPLSLLTTQYGARIVMTLLMIIASLTMYLLSTVSGFTGFLLCSFGIGLCGGGFAVGAGQLESSYSPAEKGPAQSVLGIASIGIVITLVLMPQVLGLNSEGDSLIQSWRTLPFALSILLFVSALGFFFLNKSSVQTKHPIQSFGLVTRILSAPAVARFGLYTGFVFAALVTLSLWVIPYSMNLYGLNLSQAGILSGGLVLTFLFMQLLSNKIVNKIGLRSLMSYVFIFCGFTTALLAIPEMSIGLPMAIPLDNAFADGTNILHLGNGYWRFVALCFVLAIFSGLGRGAVSWGIKSYFPDNTGLVTSVVNTMGVGISGLLLLFYTFLQLKFGLWIASWLVLTLLSVVCWVWMQAISRTIVKNEVPELDQLIESSAKRLISIGGNKTLPADVESLLQGLPFFHDLSHEALHSLAMIGEFRSMKSGQTVFQQGDPGDALYVLIDGGVNIYLIGEDEKRIDLAELGGGAYFGDLALIDGQPRSASAQTSKDCEFFLISRHQFLSLMSESPRILADVLVGLSEHIRNSNQRYADENEKKARLEVQAELDRHQSIAQMVAGVAHEINTPLGIVNHAASIITEEINSKTLSQLAKDEDAEDVLEGIALAGQLIQDNIRRADKLITSFKNLSVRQIVDQKEEVRISEVIEDVLRLYGLKAQASNLNLEFVNELGEDDLWDGYAGPLSQILLNILSNADRYAYPGDEGGKVEVCLARADQALYSYTITLTDFGVGIEETEKVFEAFYTTGRSIGGTGIGLSVVYNLVTFQLDGSIELESALGEGSRFVINLPKIVKEKHEGTHLIEKQ